MMVSVKLTGATSNIGNHWKSINWNKVKANVKRLQMRIAKAEREDKSNRVKSLQWLLSHSFSAKLLAVKRVTSNKGAKTPGVDGVIWNTPARKIKGALSLQRKGYKALPLRRILISKKGKKGKFRPLGIPTIRDRAMQALYLITLEPIAETKADPNSYGFRYYRSCRDAIAQCFCVLGKKHYAGWILDADIKACFDYIDHSWLMSNIPMDKMMLRQWLECGYFQDKKLYPTKSGTPQGGILSPTLANMTLDGLEGVIRKSCPNRLKGNQNIRTKVHFIRYADDLVTTASTKELLENNIIPAINDFLKPRGLMLSPEKTRILKLEDGFDFLGQNIRRGKHRLLITPSKENENNFLSKVRTLVKSCHGWKTEDMIRKLNPVIRGWAYYHRFIHSYRSFWLADKTIFQALQRWMRRRHPEKGYGWLIKTYFNSPNRKWGFTSYIRDRSGKRKLLELITPSCIKIVQYIKIKGESYPFNPIYEDYFKMRREFRNYRLHQTNNLAAGLQ